MKDAYCYKCRVFYPRVFRSQPHICQVIDPSAYDVPLKPSTGAYQKAYRARRALAKYSARAENSGNKK